MAFKDDEERRAYFREYNKGWYKRHKERLLEKRKQHNEELRVWLKQYKSKLRCIECGESLLLAYSFITLTKRKRVLLYKDKDMRAAYRKAYGRNWYEQNKERVMERKKQRRREIADWFRKYKSSLYCMDCGISHPAVLQFHHRNRTDKSFTIADVARSADSIKQIMSEIKKCDVLCVNCHAKRHWREKNETEGWEEIAPEG